MINWRRVLGAFQFTISIKTKEELLLPEERLLAVARWMLLVMPPHKRWHPVLERYIDQLAGRVRGFGGNPAGISPSPTGQVPVPRPHPRPPDQRAEVTGKIDGIVYDHFGDFEGFVLETESGHQRRFESRERAILKLVHRAWAQRTRVTVVEQPRHPHTPCSVILRAGGGYAGDPRWRHRR